MDNVRLCGPNNWREKSGRKPKQQDRPKRSKRSRPEWQKVVDCCLKSPAAPSIGTNGARALTSNTLMPPQTDEDSTKDGVAQNYVHTSVRMICFQERLSLILFLSYMSVLKTKRDTTASVFDRMKAAFGLSLQTQFAQEMLNGLQNAHAVIRALEGNTDLALCQATEIFVAYGPYSSYHYRKMTSLCINYFSDQLSTKHESFVYSNDGTKMCIPYMVFREYPGETLADVHRFLGYNTDCLTCNAKTSPTTTFETTSPGHHLQLLSTAPFDTRGLRLYQPQAVNRIPDTSLAIKYAIVGDTKGLWHLFLTGQASPTDVSDSRGYTLLRWTFYGGFKNYRTAQFLITLGVPVDKESYEHFWDFAFRWLYSDEEAKQLKCILLNPPEEYVLKDWAEAQEFPRIHKIVLERLVAVKSHGSLGRDDMLKQVLAETPLAAWHLDAMGRTALDWATARAQHSMMRILISANAPVDNMDREGRTPVLHAVDSGNLEALRILMLAKANVDPLIPRSLHRSSPLIAATFGCKKCMVKLLLDYGAKVDARNPEGRTALYTIADRLVGDFVDRADIARYLLDAGADMFEASHESRNSPLVAAILSNNHAVLQTFVNLPFETSRLAQFELPPVVVQHMDDHTISILTASKMRIPTLRPRIAASHYG